LFRMIRNVSDHRQPAQDSGLVLLLLNVLRSLRNRLSSV
jgi:hypothetical protein